MPYRQTSTEQIGEIPWEISLALFLNLSPARGGFTRSCSRQIIVGRSSANVKGNVASGPIRSPYRRPGAHPISGREWLLWHPGWVKPARWDQERKEQNPLPPH